MGYSKGCGIFNEEEKDVSVSAIRKIYNKAGDCPL